MPRFFITEPPQDGLIWLTDENAHHAARVLRLRVGETVTLCDGRGTDYECAVESLGERVACRVMRQMPSESEPRQQFTLFMALPKGDKMELIVQKAVELGVRRIVPYSSRNCVSRPDEKGAAKKVQRWQKIALEAAKQAGRGIQPTVEEICPFAEAVRQAAACETRLYFYELERETHLQDALRDGIGDTVSLMIGPEGGFDPTEVEQAKQAGMTSVSLGPRILRCETAPIAALSAVLYAGGNM